MKSHFFSLLALFFYLPVWGQAVHELGAGVGGTFFLGDVGPYGVSAPKRMQYSGFYRYQTHPHYALRVNFAQGSFAASDNESGLPERQDRNMSFSTDFWEVSLRGEIFYLPQKMRSSSRQFSPYLYAGVGVMGFTPKGLYQGAWIPLQPLGTEGQGTLLNPDPLYSQQTVVLPLGMGVRLRASDLWTVGAEGGWSFTTSDYLDDVSGSYVSTAGLLALKGGAAAYFADPSLVVRDRTGLPRGNESTEDLTAHVQLYVALHLETFLERCADFLHF